MTFDNDMQLRKWCLEKAIEYRGDPVQMAARMYAFISGVDHADTLKTIFAPEDMAEAAAEVLAPVPAPAVHPEAKCLTKQQRAVLTVLLGVAQTGRDPGYADVVADDGLKMGYMSVYRHCQSLENRGYIEIHKMDKQESIIKVLLNVDGTEFIPPMAAKAAHG